MINVNYKLLNKEIVLYNSDGKKTYLDYKRNFFLIKNQKVDLIKFLKDNLNKVDPVYATKAVLLSTINKKQYLPFIGYMISNLLNNLYIEENEIFNKYKPLIYNVEKNIDFGKIFLENEKMFYIQEDNKCFVLNADYIINEIKKHLQHYAEYYNEQKFESTTITNVLNSIFYFFKNITDFQTLEDIITYQKYIFSELFIIYFEILSNSYTNKQLKDADEMLLFLIKDKIFADINIKIILFLEKNI